MAKPRLEGFWTFDENRLNMSDRDIIDNMFEVFEGTPNSIKKLSTMTCYRTLFVKREFHLMTCLLLYKR